MTFQSLTFFAFFVLFYAVHIVIHRTRYYIHWLLLGSYVFYGWWNPFFLLLILFTTAVDYFAVTFMSRAASKKNWLVVSIMCNLGVLGFFKYGSFAINNANALLSWLHIPFTIQNPGMILPVAISFFTFRSMTYTIDFYRGKIAREPNFFCYASFIALFPQLIAGPIDRAEHLLPQLKAPARISLGDVSQGLSLFIIGLFKKVVIADYLAIYVNKMYDAPLEASGFALAAATFAYTWQIYFDFSGYTDMARGVAKSMGYDLVLNFNNPYLATGLGDFWQRWHISLSTWFKDYLYIPLGGNRSGKGRTYINMSITMIVSGLWHGAAWTFVIWGALHAIGRIITRELEQTSFYVKKIPNILKLIMVFVFINFTWIFFRARSFDQAIYIVKKIATGPYDDPRFPVFAAVAIFAVWLYQYMYESRLRSFLEKRTLRIACLIVMILLILLFSSDSAQPFIYQQF